MRNLKPTTKPLAPQRAPHEPRLKARVRDYVYQEGQSPRAPGSVQRLLYDTRCSQAEAYGREWESHVTRRLFGGMLQRIMTLPVPAG